MPQVSPLNEKIREIFRTEGDIPTDQVVDRLKRKGVNLDDKQRIHNVRNAMKNQGTMGSAKSPTAPTPVNGKATDRRVNNPDASSPDKKEETTTKQPETSKAEETTQVNERLVNKDHLFEVIGLAKKVGGLEQLKELATFLQELQDQK